MKIDNVIYLIGIAVLLIIVLIVIAVAKIRKNFELVSRKLVEVEAKDAIRNWKNPITGEYVMEVYGIGPCNIIGMIKERVKNAVLDGVIENNFEAADKFMREIAPEYGLVAVK